MADIRAFRGFRYDLGKVGSLAAVVAPPYDVIDAALQEKLYDASPYNAVRVELTTDEPDDIDSNARYDRASSALKDWLTDGTLQQDTARSLYVYEQEFTVDGTTHTRRGIMARVRLEPLGTGRIFPHEQTISGPKEDRLKLLPGDRVQRLADLRPVPGRGRGVRQARPDHAPPAANRGDRPSRRRQPPVGGHRLGRDQRGHRPARAEAGVHRRRPPPLRDGPEIPRRTPRPPARCRTTSRPRTSA